MPTISGTVYDSVGAPAAGRIVRAYRRDTGALLGEAVTSDGISIAGDPHYANVSLLLHCGGADNSTVFTDSSAAPKTVTANGNAKISTAQSKFGGASAFFDGNGDYLSAPASADYTFGTGDFTVELWINTTTTAEDVLVDQYSGADSWQLSVKSGKLSWYGKSNAYVLTSLASVNDGTWHHVAATREAGVLRFFVDGAASGQATDTTGYSKTIVLGIGAQVASRNSSYDYAGYIDDLRITKGVARYTANFTPPTAPHYDRLPVDALPVGSYDITTAYTGEVQRIVLDDDAGTLYNDLIDRVVLA